VRFATIAEWLAWQQVAHPVAIDPGLERAGEVCRRLALPRPRTVLTVGGTNGKGSVCAYLDAMLGAAGYDVGLFTSPHLVAYNERMRIGGRDADDTAIIAAFARIDEARGDISLTFFEWSTLAAFVLFAEERVDVAVLEVGMGGRLDAVNLADADVAAVVSVGLDHCEWLGGTTEEIGVEKAGIFRPGRPAIFGSRAMPDSVARAAAAPRGDACVAHQSFGPAKFLLRALASPRCGSRCGHVLTVRCTEDFIGGRVGQLRGRLLGVFARYHAQMIHEGQTHFKVTASARRDRPPAGNAQGQARGDTHGAPAAAPGILIRWHHGLKVEMRRRDARARGHAAGGARRRAEREQQAQRHAAHGLPGRDHQVDPS
jgi:hypothetical protein